MREFIRKYKMIISIAVGLLVGAATTKGYIDYKTGEVIKIVVNGGLNAAVNGGEFEVPAE